MLTVGVLTPHAVAGPEVEIPAMVSGCLDVAVGRISGDNAVPRPPSDSAELRALATSAALHRALVMLNADPVDAIAHASTTTAYAIGRAAEADLIESLRRLAGVPVVTSGLAAALALKTFGVRRVSLVHPPWFRKETEDLGAAYFGEHDIDAVVVTPRELPRNPDRVLVEQVVDCVGSQVDASTEAVFLAGNGFRAATAIEALERRTGQLVIEANQVLLWALLAAAETTLRVDGYGSLLGVVPPRAIE